MLQLILAMQEFGKRSPGFEREAHGMKVDGEGNYWMRGVVEAPNGKRRNGTGKNRPPSSAPPVKRNKKGVVLGLGEPPNG